MNYDLMLAQILRLLQQQQSNPLPALPLGVPMLAPGSGITDPSLFNVFDIPPRGINTGVMPTRQDQFVPVATAPLINVPQTSNPTYTNVPRYDNAMPNAPLPSATPARDTYGNPNRPSNTPEGDTRDEVLRRMQRHQSGGIFPLLGF